MDPNLAIVCISLVVVVLGIMGITTIESHIKGS